MKHNWKIEPRGKKSKYYVCTVCGLKVAGFTKKDIDASYPECKPKKKFYYECPDCGFSTNEHYGKDGEDLTEHDCR